MGTRACYLCDARGITLHRFPPNPELRRLWKEACDLTERDDVTNVKICSKHFASEDYTQNSSKVLKYGVVPTVRVPNPTVVKPAALAACAPYILETPTPTELQATDYEHVVSLNSEEFEIGDVIDVKVESDGEVLDFETTVVPCSPDSYIIKIEDTEFMHPDWAEEISLHPPQKSRRFFEPRYVSEIELEDMSTPRKAKKILFLANREIEKKNKKIRALQSDKRHLQKKVASLKELVSHLKDEVSEMSRVKHEASKKSRVKQEASKKSVVKEEASEMSHVKEEASKKSHVKQEASKKSHMKKEASEMSHVKEEAPKKSRVKGEASEMSHVKEEAPKKSRVKEETSKKSRLKDKAPKKPKIEYKIEEFEPIPDIGEIIDYIM